MGWLEGQVALVTGGGSGIGRGIVARFLVEGVRVGVLERVPERIEQLQAAFGEYVVPVQGDVTRLEDNKRGVEQTVRAFGQLDIFVLGFTHKLRQHIERSALGVPLDVVLLDLGGTAVELISYTGATVAPSPTGEQLGYRMMALEVEDMDKALAYLRTKGIEPSWGPRVTEGQYARAEIRDPHGHRIELRQWF